MFLIICGVIISILLLTEISADAIVEFPVKYCHSDSSNLCTPKNYILDDANHPLLSIIEFADQFGNFANDMDYDLLVWDILEKQNEYLSSSHYDHLILPMDKFTNEIFLRDRSPVTKCFILNVFLNNGTNINIQFFFKTGKAMRRQLEPTNCPALIIDCNDLYLGSLLFFYSDYYQEFDRFLLDVDLADSAYSISQLLPMPTYHLVVAKYKEDISWLRHFVNISNSIFVYDKYWDLSLQCVYDFPVIPKLNIGREVETFIAHIIAHYDRLPDFVVFIQADPFPHMQNITELSFQAEIHYLLSRNPPTQTIPLFTDKCYEADNLYPALRLNEYFPYLFNTSRVGLYAFSPGVQYIIPKAVVLSRPLSFYKKIYKMILNTEQYTWFDAHFSVYDFDKHAINGWTMERLFGYVFDSAIPVSNLMI